MISANQLYSYGRSRKPTHIWSVSLHGNPQKRGWIRRLLFTTPRKPNSAIRKICQVVLVTRRRLRVKIPGSTHRPQKSNIVLIRGKGFKDTPGINYTLIRGAYDCLPLYNKIKRRSIYGVPSDGRIHVRRILRK